MTSSEPTSRLDATVIISTHNRAEILQQTLQRLALQEPNGVTWEVIVVDNGCTDNTQGILGECGPSLPLVSLKEPELGKNRAINRALAVARGDLLIFTDDDVLTEPDWVAAYVDAAKRWADDSVFCGPVIPKFPEKTSDWIKDESFPYASIAFAALDYSDVEEESSLAFGPNLAIRSQTLENMAYNENIGPQGKNYAMGSEAELLRRLESKGERFIYIPSTRVQHVIRPEQITTPWLLGRAYRFGRGHVRLKEQFQGRRVLGVPGYLWKRLGWAAAGRARSLFYGSRERCIAGMRYHRIRGNIVEYRCQVERLSQRST